MDTVATFAVGFIAGVWATASLFAYIDRLRTDIEMMVRDAYPVGGEG